MFFSVPSISPPLRRRNCFIVILFDVNFCTPSKYPCRMPCSPALGTTVQALYQGFAMPEFPDRRISLPLGSPALER